MGKLYAECKTATKRDDHVYIDLILFILRDATSDHTCLSRASFCRI